MTLSIDALALPNSASLPPVVSEGYKEKGNFVTMGGLKT